MKRGQRLDPDFSVLIFYVYVYWKKIYNKSTKYEFYFTWKNEGLLAGGLCFP